MAGQPGPAAEGPNHPVTPGPVSDAGAAETGRTYRWDRWSGLARGGRGRVESNLAAIRLVRQLEEQGRLATRSEQETVLAHWTSWGAVPALFDDRAGSTAFEGQRAELRDLLTEGEWSAARRTVLNAHYTSPAYVRAIWDGLSRAGFEGGSVLEPGCGAGVFIGSAPETARMVGVELDPMTAKIAGYLHPDATIRAESFAKSPFPDEAFDAVVGNVPFADVTLNDERHNRDRLSMHNHFVLKSLALTRPGGMVAVLTSRYTLDAANPTARERMYDVADLVAAVRLPTGAHADVAGTDAVTDLVMLRKRLPGESPGDDSWVRTEMAPLVTAEGEPVKMPVNTVWLDHPERVLGQMGVGHGMHGRHTLVVQPTPAGSVASALARQVTAQVDAAAEQGLVWVARQAAVAEPSLAQEPVSPVPGADTVGARFEGHLAWDGTKEQFTQVVAGVPVEISVPVTQHRELRDLLGLRDAVMGLLVAESTGTTGQGDLEQRRADLGARYDRYVEQYGPINRVALSERGKQRHGQQVLDEDTGEPVMIVTRRYPPAIRTFRSDPHSPTVRALETFDETSGTATKMAIFTQRVVEPRAPVTSADSPADALAIVLDTAGEVRLDDVAQLLGVDPEQARERLGELVFHDPAEQRLVPAAEYLSGNVRTKLLQARDAALEDPRYEVNVGRLTQVLPPDLGPGEISVRLGAVWLPKGDVQDFLRETLHDPQLVVEHAGGAEWAIRDANSHSEMARSAWGTTRMPAPELVERLMQQKRVVVTDPLDPDAPGGARVVNPVETEAAQEKAEQWQERFAEWVWADPERSVRLAGIYNTQFNSLVLRSYEAEGQALTLPGLASWFVPHPHQRTAVARIINEPSVGLYHAVGAGKTAEMVMGCMELRRLGLVKKPAVVVPNHMLEQFTREWLQLYPAANVLAASSDDLKGERRREFVARAAVGDWDAVVLTQGAFGKIPVSQEAERAYRSRTLEAKRVQLGRAREGGEQRSIKRIEKALLRAEEALDHRMGKVVRDPGLTWEQTGIDYLMVDELHMFKNLEITSNIASCAREGSLRAMDLDMKIEVLRDAAGPRGRVVTGATATPIANAMAEAWVMQRFLRPDLLTAAGVSDFDAWAATFGQVVSTLEVAPQGGGQYRTVERFAQFVNLPELLRMWHVSADVRTTADLGLPVPLIAQRSDGQRLPETVVVPATEAHLEFMDDLGRRADLVKSRAVRPEEDNMLKISGDGRKAALDLRLVDEHAGDGLLVDVTKLDVAADRISTIWAQHRHDTYPSADGHGVHPVGGALQIVFSDLGTPNPDKWDAYSTLRDKLVERGMDRARIRFVHEANTDAKKGILFAQCRGGDVDVLIGSTAKMGVGTNIQDRAVALHHLDCPWRPADVEQREGRILRQGNHHPQVQILRYVTEQSFDAYSWQTVERKARFIAQVMHGSLTERTAEDIADDGALSASEVKALAAGDPLLLEKAQAEQDVAKLTRLERAHQRNQTYLRHAASGHEEAIIHATKQLPAVQDAIATRVSTEGDQFAATVTGHPTTRERARATEQLRAVIGPLVGQVSAMRPRVHLDQAVTLGGHQFDAIVNAGSLGAGPTLTLQMRALPDHAQVSMPTGAVLTGEGHGPITRLENLVSGGLDRVQDKLEETITSRTAERDTALAGLGKPFARHDDLMTARRRLDDLEQQMTDRAQPPAVARQNTAPVPGTEQQREINQAGLRQMKEQLARIRHDREHTVHDTHEHARARDYPRRDSTSTDGPALR